jgi:outer membrane protein TolC
LLLRIRYLQQAREIHQWLQRRESFDALASQVKRASAAVASRRSELARSVAAIRNAEDQLRALVNAPELTHDHRLEIIPTSSPRCAYAPVRIDDAMVTALQERSEIDELARELDAARVRLRVARNELMPMLDLVLESYVSGLRGQNDVGGAWIDQFSVGEPSYSAGFTFEVPLQRRAATANVQRRRGQIRQLSFRLRETIANLHAEVAAAVRDVETSHRELRARRAAMQAAEEYLELISNRWRALPGDGHSANVMLESVLDAQDRLLEEEIAFARSQVEYALSTTRLKRATGTLLQIQPLSATAR